MEYRFFFITAIIITFFSKIGSAQQFPYKEVIFRVDTNEYYYTKDKIRPDTRTYLPFAYRIDNEIVEIDFLISVPIKEIIIEESPMFTILSQCVSVGEGVYRALIRLNSASTSNFIRLNTRLIGADNDQTQWEAELLPVADFTAMIMPSQDELFVGEEIIFEIAASIPQIILPKNNWIEKEYYQYRVLIKDGIPFLHLVTFSSGNRSYEIDLELYRPLLSDNKLHYNYTFSTPVFSVKTSRLAFLSPDSKEFMLNETSGIQGIEFQMDNHRLLRMNKTYRVENSESNGVLIAEIFTKNQLANNKLLCEIKIYNTHRSEQGFLYIKDGDNPQFLTNFTVLPKTTISAVKISRDGKSWNDRAMVYPGESVIVKIEGESIHRASLVFEGMERQHIDTILVSEREAEYRLRLPVGFIKSRIHILNHNVPSGLSITVSEYQRPRQFDFMSIDYGEGFTGLDKITGPVFYDGNIRDIVIRADASKIDEGNRLFGKQYFEIEVKIFGTRGELVEIVNIRDQVICPDEASIRHSYYNKSDCKNFEISLNQHLSKKTYDLDNWSRLLITFKHTTGKYTDEGKPKSIEIILQKRIRFDIDVSFPAGLLIISPNEEKIGNLSGISMAMVAQFSFYQKNRISRLQPYKIGAGFLALNAFNFSENITNRDMSLVVIASLYPTRRESKMTFPLYFGGGYFVSQGKFFWLLGPGIRVSF